MSSVPASAFERAASERGELSVASAWRSDGSSTGRWIASHVGRYRPFAVAFFSLAVCSILCFSYASIVTGKIAEQMLQPGGGRLLEHALTLFVLLALSGLCTLAASFCAEKISKGFRADAREELYLSVLAKSQTFHGRQCVGDLMARATDDTQMLGLMVVPGSNMIIESALAIVAVRISRRPVAGVARRPRPVLVCHFIALRAYVRELGPVMTRQRSEFGLLSAGLEETVSGIEVVKASARSLRAREDMLASPCNLRDTTVAQGVIEARYLPLLLFASPPDMPGSDMPDGPQDAACSFD